MAWSNGGCSNNEQDNRPYPVHLYGCLDSAVPTLQVRVENSIESYRGDLRVLDTPPRLDSGALVLG